MPRLRWILPTGVAAVVLFSSSCSAPKPTPSTPSASPSPSPLSVPVSATPSPGEPDQRALDLIDEASRLMRDAAALQKLADRKYDEVTDKISENFPEDRTNLQPAAQSAVENYGNASGKIRDAAEKFKAAAAIEASDKFKRYALARAAENQSRAEQLTALKDRAQAFLDAPDFGGLKGRVDPLTAKLVVLAKQVKAHENEALTIEKQDPQLLRRP